MEVVIKRQDGGKQPKSKGNIGIKHIPYATLEPDRHSLLSYNPIDVNERI